MLKYGNNYVFDQHGDQDNHYGVCGNWEDDFRDYEDHWDQDQEYFFKEDENLAMKRSLLSRLAECASRQVFFLMNLVDNNLSMLNILLLMFSFQKSALW